MCFFLVFLVFCFFVSSSRSPHIPFVFVTDQQNFQWGPYLTFATLTYLFEKNNKVNCEKIVKLKKKKKSLLGLYIGKVGIPWETRPSIYARTTRLSDRGVNGTVVPAWYML